MVSDSCIININTQCYVITIKTDERSVAASKRCISSAADFNLHVNSFDAFTPEDDLFKILNSKGISDENINIKRRTTRSFFKKRTQVACFTSHLALWEKCIEIDSPIIIFEHDAIIIDYIPLEIINGTGFKQLINLGRPHEIVSMSTEKRCKFQSNIVNKLEQGEIHVANWFPEFKGKYNCWKRGCLPKGIIRPYSFSSFLGTHAYIIKPKGAIALIKYAQETRIKPVDLYLNMGVFDFLEELWPWPVKESSNFSTTIEDPTSLENKA